MRTRPSILFSGGNLKCWGKNSNGNAGQEHAHNVGTSTTKLATQSAIDLGNFNGASHSVLDFDVGYSHTCAIIAGGAVKCWGKEYEGSLGQDSQSGSNGDKKGDASDEMGNDLPHSLL